MSFNSRLRKVVYGDTRRTQTNPMLALPAGVTGTTWHGTGFEAPPREAVELDEAALPWELTAEPPESVQRQPQHSHAFPFTIGALLAILAIGYGFFYGGF
jgi:hypothetical protein